MFSIHRKLFLASKKVRIVKIIPPQVSFTQYTNSPSKISYPPPPPSPHPLPLFGKPSGLVKHQLTGFCLLGESPPHQPKICSSPLPHLEKSPTVDSPHHIFISPTKGQSAPLNNNGQVITQWKQHFFGWSHCSCSIFGLISYSLGT